MRLRHCVSDAVVSNTRAPQGTVLSPFLFTLYTTDFSYQTESCHLLKFSDDSAVVGCISKVEEADYRAVVDNFVTWCELNHLQLNTAKTKELVVDLRRTRTPVTPVSITWTSLNTTNILGCSSTINWTGPKKLKSSTRRDRAAFISIFILFASGTKTI